MEPGSLNGGRNDEELNMNGSDEELNEIQALEKVEEEGELGDAVNELNISKCKSQAYPSTVQTQSSIDGNEEARMVSPGRPANGA